jgi:hypothetical protein
MITIPYGEYKLLDHHYKDPELVRDDGVDEMQIDITRTDSGASLISTTLSYLWGTSPTGTMTIAAASAGDVQIDYTVTAGTEAAIEAQLKKGRKIWIDTSVDGPAEIVTIDYINPTTNIIYLERPLLESHYTATEITSLTWSYALNATDTDTWTAGLEVKIVWSDEYSGSHRPAASYIAKVVKTAFNISGIRDKFAAIYPHVYNVIEHRFEEIEVAASKRLKIYFQTKDRNLDLLTDLDMLEPAMIEQIYLLGATRSDTNALELEMAKTQLNEDLQRLEQADIWFDENQDNVKDETEVGVDPWYPVDRGI